MFQNVSLPFRKAYFGYLKNNFSILAILINVGEIPAVRVLAGQVLPAVS
jgi:hypothetical protein